MAAGRSVGRSAKAANKLNASTIRVGPSRRRSVREQCTIRDGHVYSISITNMRYCRGSFNRPQWLLIEFREHTQHTQTPPLYTHAHKNKRCVFGDRKLVSIIERIFRVALETPDEIERKTRKHPERLSTRVCVCFV